MLQEILFFTQNFTIMNNNQNENNDNVKSTAKVQVVT